MLSSEAIIKQFVDDYSPKLEKTTLKGYKTSITQLLSFSKKSYNEITPRDIRIWLNYLEENGYMVSTIKTKMFGLRLFYQFCMEEELTNYNPVESIPIPRMEDKLPYYLTHEQLAQLRLICSGNKQQRASVELLYTTGISINELTSMKLEDINWGERMIRIPKGKGKKERIVLFTKECEQYLKAYLLSRSDDHLLVFINLEGTGAITTRQVDYRFEIYREKLGFYVTPHTLRHTFAAHLAMKGMPLGCLQVLLGHEKPRHTQLYARLHSHAQKQMYDKWM